MPYREFNLEQVAEYLHLARTDVERLVKDQLIPFELRGSRPVFRKREVDAWASQRILGMTSKHLSEYHTESFRKTREILPEAALMPEMIQPGFIEPRLRSKTKASVLRDMVGLGEKTRRLLDGRALLEGLEEREALCSTALPGGVAFLHTRQHQTYLVETSFLAVGRTVQEIHYGAPDGRPTDLFFLVCCEDDRFHLHTLARLCLMAVKTDLLAGLRAASDAAAMHEILLSCEQSVIGTLPR